MKKNTIDENTRREIRKRVRDLQWYIDEHLDLAPSQKRRLDRLVGKVLRLLIMREAVEKVRDVIDALLEWVRQLD